MERAVARDAVRTLLKFIGEQPDRDGLKDTPDRVARALLEMTKGYREDPEQILSTMFDERCDEMVVLRDIPFSSLCEHHLLAFSGMAAVGYIPHAKVVGLSKLARLVRCYAQRLQVEERLTEQVATARLKYVRPRGVGVVIRAAHACMHLRGVRAHGEMVTSALLGVMRDKEPRTEFLHLSSHI